MPDTQRAAMEREFHDIEGRIMDEPIHKTGHPKEALMEQLLEKQDEALQND